MMNLSVLVHENVGSPHLHVYPNIAYYMKVQGAKWVEIYISILGASFIRHCQECSCSEPPL